MLMCIGERALDDYKTIRTGVDDCRKHGEAVIVF